MKKKIKPKEGGRRLHRVLRKPGSPFPKGTPLPIRFLEKKSRKKEKGGIIENTKAVGEKAGKQVYTAERDL